MVKTVISKHTFSQGILQVQYSLLEHFYPQTISKVNFYEFNRQTGEYDYISNEDGNVITVQANYWDGDNKQVPAVYCVNVQQQHNEDHLIKAVIYVEYNQSTYNEYTPCCAVTEHDYQTGKDFWVFEEWYVDLSVYEKTLLDSIQLKCTDCDVPMDTINGLLKLFAVRAAAESASPQLETLFSKLTCGKNFKHIRNFKKCNCNG